MKKRKPRIARLQSKGMSHVHHAEALRRSYKPLQLKWWVRIGKGNSFKFYNIGDIKATKPLNITMDLNELQLDFGTMIYFGVGPVDIGVRGQFLVLSRLHKKKRGLRASRNRQLV